MGRVKGKKELQEPISTIAITSGNIFKNLIDAGSSQKSTNLALEGFECRAFLYTHGYEIQMFL